MFAPATPAKSRSDGAFLALVICAWDTAARRIVDASPNQILGNVARSTHRKIALMQSHQEFILIPAL
jgi:hypothetical protein